MAHDYDVSSSEVPFTGRVIELHCDLVAMPGGGSSQRDYVTHPGAVGVVALRGDEILLVNQYRHPVRRRLDELPAGLLDIAAEPALVAAKRELVEEAGLTAGRWNVLVDVLTSPGMSDEAVRLYLARDVTVVDRDVQEHEEAELTSVWIPLDDAVQRVMGGAIENSLACLGILAAAHARGTDFADLRAAAAPWPSRKG